MTGAYDGSYLGDATRLSGGLDALSAAQALTALGPEEIDQLPFGYIALTRNGTIVRYNRYEANLSRMDLHSVIGRNFFSEVAPCTQVQELGVLKQSPTASCCLRSSNKSMTIPSL